MQERSKIGKSCLKKIYFRDKLDVVLQNCEQMKTKYASDVGLIDFNNILQKDWFLIHFESIFSNCKESSGDGWQVDSINSREGLRSI